jgi:hypothetical protein
MDNLYYSNYCKHCKKVLDFLSKSGIAEKLNCICIDKRKLNTNTNQTFIQLDDGKQVLMPPNLSSVPALLLINKGYSIVLGSDIIKHYEPEIKKKLESANFGDGEPSSYSLKSSSGGSNIVSERFTFYDMSPDELSAKGMGGQRQLYNYVPVSNTSAMIATPPDTYKPDKVSNEVTIDTLQQQRNSDVPMKNSTPQYQYQVPEL